MINIKQFNAECKKNKTYGGVTIWCTPEHVVLEMETDGNVDIRENIASIGDVAALFIRVETKDGTLVAICSASTESDVDKARFSFANAKVLKCDEFKQSHCFGVSVQMNL